MGIEYDASDVSEGFSQGVSAGGRKRRPLKFSADAVEKAKRRFTSSPAATSGQPAINHWSSDHRAGPASLLCRCLTGPVHGEHHGGRHSKGKAVMQTVVVVALLYRLLPVTGDGYYSRSANRQGQCPCGWSSAAAVAASAVASE